MANGDNCCLSTFWIIFWITIFAIFAIIGGCLMGLASPPRFPTPQFIAGFVFIMVDAVAVFVLIVVGCYYLFTWV